MKKLIIPEVFYACLCIFSIVVGILYFTGIRELNPLELSDNFVTGIKDIHAFAKMMGVVTFFVGIVQGLTAFAIWKRRFYFLPFGFTVFSILSVVVKLTGKINAFPIIKLIAYLIMLAILIVDRKEFSKRPAEIA